LNKLVPWPEGAGMTETISGSLAKPHVTALPSHPRTMFATPRTPPSSSSLSSIFFFFFHYHYHQQHLQFLSIFIHLQVAAIEI